MSEAHYTVYKLTDPEGKIYIGVTGQTVEQRWRKGYGYSKDTPIRKAIDRWGWESFRHEVLCENLTREEAEEKERWYISRYDSSDPAKGYNRFLGGLGKGANMSETTKLLSAESKRKLYEAHPEIAEKIRNTVSTRYETDPTYRRRVGQGVRAAYEKDPSIRVRIREKSRELWRSPAYRERASDARRETCVLNFDLAERERSAQKKRYEDCPEERERVRAQMRAYLSRPENRAFVNSSSRPKPVICVETGKKYPSQLAAERETGFVSIHKVCARGRGTCGGWHWRYLTEEELRAGAVPAGSGA